jgi:hypothetical protein
MPRLYLSPPGRGVQRAARTAGGGIVNEAEHRAVLEESPLVDRIVEMIFEQRCESFANLPVSYPL